MIGYHTHLNPEFSTRDDNKPVRLTVVELENLAILPLSMLGHCCGNE